MVRRAQEQLDEAMEKLHIVSPGEIREERNAAAMYRVYPVSAVELFKYEGFGLSCPASESPPPRSVSSRFQNRVPDPRAPAPCQKGYLELRYPRLRGLGWGSSQLGQN